MGGKLEKQLKKGRRQGNDDHSSTMQTVKRQKRSCEGEGEKQVGKETEMPTNENKKSQVREK